MKILITEKQLDRLSRTVLKEQTILRDEGFINSLSQNVLDAYYGLKESSCGAGTTNDKFLESIKKIQSKSDLKQLNDALRKKPICGDYASLDDVLNGEMSGDYDVSLVNDIKKYFEDNKIATLNYGPKELAGVPTGEFINGTIKIN